MIYNVKITFMMLSQRCSHYLEAIKNLLLEMTQLLYPPTTLVSATPPPWLPQLARPTNPTNLVKEVQTSKSQSKKAKQRFFKKHASFKICTDN